MKETTGLLLVLFETRPKDPKRWWCCDSVCRTRPAPGGTDEATNPNKNVTDAKATARAYEIIEIYNLARAIGSLNNTVSP